MRLTRETVRGQALVEYSLLLGLITIIGMLVVESVGAKTSSSFSNVQSQITAPTPTVPVMETETLP